MLEPQISYLEDFMSLLLIVCGGTGSKIIGKGNGSIRLQKKKLNIFISATFLFCQSFDYPDIALNDKILGSIVL